MPQDLGGQRSLTGSEEWELHSEPLVIWFGRSCPDPRAVL